MRWNKVFKSMLKTAAYIVDQTADQVDRASERASYIADQARGVVDDARSVIYPREDHTLRNIMSFAAGVGLGIGVGMLIAPASGAEIRGSIGDKVQDISNKVKGRAATQSYSTGTE
jgi:hypothetical protein